MTTEFIFDTAKPIFILEVINTISEAAKAAVEKLQASLKKRAHTAQELMSSLLKLGKSGKSLNHATMQSEAYEDNGVRTPGELASILAQSRQLKSDMNGKGGSGSRNL